MKKFVLPLIIFLALINTVFSQSRTSGKGNFYMGGGYSLLIFTNSDAYSIYPVVNFNASSFMSEFTVYAGYKFNKNIAVEFNPGIIWARAQSNNGFYFNDGVNRYFYQPIESDMFAMPLNAKVKVFPFAGKEKSFADDMYFGIGGGAMFISEQYNNNIYADNNLNGYITTRSSSNTLWRPDAFLSFGIDFSNKYGFGLEGSYRFVPLATNGTQPVITSVASNFNSVNLSIKVLLNFY